MSIASLVPTTFQLGTDKRDVIARLTHHQTDENGPMLATGGTNPLPVTVVAGTPSVATKATFVRGTKAPASTGTPEALAAAGTYVSSVVIIAERASRVANTGSVYIDAINTNDGQLIELPPGASYSFTAPAGKVIDLADIFVDSTTLTDGVFFLGLV